MEERVLLITSEVDSEEFLITLKKTCQMCSKPWTIEEQKTYSKILPKGTHPVSVGRTMPG